MSSLALAVTAELAVEDAELAVAEARGAVVEWELRRAPDIRPSRRDLARLADCEDSRRFYAILDARIEALVAAQAELALCQLRLDELNADGPSEAAERAQC